MDDEVTTEESLTEPPAASDRPGRAHIVFFATMALLALMVTITAVTLHGSDARRAGGERRCDHIDMNVQLRWDDCGYGQYCDAEDGYLTRSQQCCLTSERSIDCCFSPRLIDPRDGLFDAEVEFADIERVEHWC